MEDIDKIKELVQKYVRGVWKNRWIAIAIAWPVMLAGIALVDRINDRYTATTTVFIDSSSMLKPLLKGLAIQADHNSILRLMINRLLSRPNLERALEEMGMEATNANRLENLVEDLKRRIVIAAKKQTNTFNITYADEDRDRAKRMVETLLDIFVRDTEGTSEDKSVSAIAFLNKQIDKYDGLLREAEKRREDFKRKNVGLMPGDGANYYSELQKNEKKIEETKLSLAESINRRDQIQIKLDEFTVTGDSGEELNLAAAPTELDLRIRDQQNALDDLLLQYTDEHPDVINARFVLESLEKRKEREKNQNTGQTGGSRETDITNPLYQELTLLITQAEADISTYRTRVANLEDKQKKLKNLVDIVPQIEAEMQRLDRDYQVHRKNYNELVVRREQAKISEDAQSDTKSVQFRVIEPPFVPLKPDFPNRGLFDIAVVMLAIIIGYGVSLLISFFQPVFYNQKDLSSTFGYAVLGSVTKFETADVVFKRRKNLAFFAAANVLLVAVGGILIIIHAKGHVLLNFASGGAPV